MTRQNSATTKIQQDQTRLNGTGTGTGTSTFVVPVSPVFADDFLVGNLIAH